MVGKNGPWAMKEALAITINTLLHETVDAKSKQSSDHPNDEEKNKNKNTEFATKTTSNAADLTAAFEQGSGLSAVADIFHDFGLVMIPGYFSADQIDSLRDQADAALEAVTSEHLEPRGLEIDGPKTFEFTEVRKRSSHCIDNRYGLLDDAKSPISIVGRRLVTKDMRHILFPGQSNVQLKILRAGVIHAFPRSMQEDQPPPPEQWHREGASLFAHDYHPTHCFDVFIPLTDIDETNGTIEFVAGTHEDSRHDSAVTELNLAFTQGRSGRHTAAVQAVVLSGTVIVADARLLRRGLSNQSDEERPVLYFTVAHHWFQIPLAFPSQSIQRHSEDDPHSQAYDKICRRLFHVVTGRLPPNAVKDYGHKYYTLRFDLLLAQRLVLNEDQDQAMDCLSAIMAFSTLVPGDKEVVCREFVYALGCQEARDRKQEALLHVRDTQAQHVTDFSTLEAHVRDAKILMNLTTQIIFEDTTLLSKFGFPLNDFGVCVVLAMLKAHATSSLLGAIGVSPQRIENCFSVWWNCASSRSRFEWAKTPSKDRSACRLLVVWSNLESSLVGPEWKDTLHAAGLLDLDHLDVMFAMDFGCSWYTQDPACEWDGERYYESALEEFCVGYQSVAFIGERMGASAALRFCAWANAVLAFTPQVDLVDNPVVSRADFAPERRRNFTDALLAAVDTSKAKVTVHYRARCNDDAKQASLLPKKDRIHMVAYDCGDRALSIYLKEKKSLPSIVKQGLTICLEAPAAS